jgi:ribosomal protein S18 acetylase RimI-like enzyme
MTYAIGRTRRLGDADRARFARIFEEGFPPEEREPTGELLRSIEAGGRDCYLLRAGGEVAALAVLLRLRSGEADVLEYLVVDAPLRGRGLGGRLLCHVRSELTRTSPASRGIVLEVEDPDGVEGPERELRMRRIAFYERAGAELVACAPDYRAPNLTAAGSVRFRLMWLPRGGPAAGLRGDLLHRCVQGVLTESYGLDEREPLVREVLAGLAC